MDSDGRGHTYALFLLSSHMNFLEQIPLKFALTALTIIGLVTQLSASIAEDGNVQVDEILTKHLIFIAVGWIIFFTVSRFDVSYLRFPTIAGGVYLVSIGLLLATLLIGPEIKDVKRWIVVAGVQIQPSEIAKVALIIVSGYFLSEAQRSRKFLMLAGLSLLSVIVLGLVFIQPHGSMSVIIFSLVVGIVATYFPEQRKNFVYVGLIIFTTTSLLLLGSNNGYAALAGVVSIGTLVLGMYSSIEPKKIILGSFAIGLIAGIGLNYASDSLIRDYQRDRIVAFFNPEETADDEAFNSNQALIAIGNGGVWGRGFGLGTQSRLSFLPEYRTDFVFATYAEQFGFVGSTLLMAVYAFALFTIFKLAYDVARLDTFMSILAFGVGLKLLLEIFVSVGTNTAIIPATGIPLPLMSAGGTSILMTFFSFGLIQSIISHQPQDIEESNFVDIKEVII